MKNHLLVSILFVMLLPVLGCVEHTKVTVNGVTTETTKAIGQATATSSVSTCVVSEATIQKLRSIVANMKKYYRDGAGPKYVGNFFSEGGPKYELSPSYMVEMQQIETRIDEVNNIPNVRNYIAQALARAKGYQEAMENNIPSSERHLYEYSGTPKPPDLTVPSGLCLD